MTNKYRKKTAKKPGAPGVRPKKYLGQHFLTDGPTAEKIAATLQLKNYGNVLEIGPGTGALTKYLLQRDI
ncbi:MAG: rRNA adenine N-6-methyltransferase family protein, partial [Marinirhabdus sp.]